MDKQRKHGFLGISVKNKDSDGRPVCCCTKSGTVWFCCVCRRPFSLKGETVAGMKFLQTIFLCVIGASIVTICLYIKWTKAQEQKDLKRLLAAGFSSETIWPNERALNKCDSECIRFTDFMKFDWPKEKPRAVIYVLSHVHRLMKLIRMLKSVEERFNKEWGYPYIIFHEENFQVRDVLIWIAGENRCHTSLEKEMEINIRKPCYPHESQMSITPCSIIPSKILLSHKNRKLLVTLDKISFSSLYGTWCSNDL